MHPLKLKKMKIYGVFDRNDCLIDTSLTERGAKITATRNGYNKIGYRIGYNAIITHIKENKTWKHY